MMATIFLSLVACSQAISPPLHDGDALGSATKPQSDKKFFGPPFPADYPEDKRPAVDKSIMDKLKSKDQPYPALQSKTDYDRDYVKDENSDSGHWKAQFEYDTLRNKMAKEAGDAKRAAGRAGKEGNDVDSAQGRSDKAGKDVDDAKKDLNDAVNGEDEAKKAEDFEGVPPSAEKLEEIKKAVAQAEANLEKEKAEFELCEKALADAKKNLEELKAAQVVMESKLAADTKLYIEQKAARFNLQKAKNEAAHSLYVTRKSGADSKLKAAQDAKVVVDQVLAEKKAKYEKAMKSNQKEQNDLAEAKKDMAKATLRLQKLRGYHPVEEAKVVVKAW